MKKTFIYLSLLLFFSTTAIAQQGKGLFFNDEKYQKVPQKAELTRSLYGNTLPSAHSLKKFAPIPKSQGPYGTCVGWASAYTALTIHQAIKNNWTDKQFITDNAFSPGFVYTLIKTNSDAGCKYGTYVDDAMEVLKTKGAPKFSDLNSSCPTVINSSLYTKAAPNKIDDYARIFGYDATNEFKIKAIKKSLSENNPVVFGMKTPNSFNYPVGDLWDPAEDPTKEYGGHAMTLIGYDDNKYGGAFEIQNSWGIDWGNQGCIWVKYNDFANFTKYAFELIDISGTNVVEDEPDLAGQLKFITSDGKIMQATLKTNHYEMNNPYASGTKFRIFISNNEPAYVYAFGSDATGEIFQIFPHNEHISPALTYKENDVAIPDEDHYIQMDNTIGTDYLCVLYSKEPLNLKTIFNEIKATYGTFNDKVHKVLNTKIVDPNHIKYGENIDFQAISHGKKIIPIIVATKHIAQ